MTKFSNNLGSSKLVFHTTSRLRRQFRMAIPLPEAAYKFVHLFDHFLAIDQGKKIIGPASAAASLLPKEEK